MDLKALINAVSDANERTRSQYHLTLGGLLDALEKADGALPVTFEDGAHPGKFDSYRGYYTDIAISRHGKPITVADFRAATAKALKTTFEGYKGGEFPASPDKSLWRSEYGDNSGEAVVSTKIADGKFLLCTKQID